ncbi:MAG TPA: EAL domain-containing protein [Symbiobacteriaceae bacterium]|nr:EAL domain-containing protein [Symbiobacteriaceae bacterium]
MKWLNRPVRSIRMIPALSVAAFVSIALFWTLGSEALVVLQYPLHESSDRIEAIQDVAGILVEAVLLYAILRKLVIRAAESEAALAESEERLRLIVDSMEAIVSVVDTDGRIIAAHGSQNNPHAQLAASVTGKLLSEVGPYQTMFEHAKPRLMAGEPVNEELVVPTPEGDRVLEVTMKVLYPKAAEASAVADPRFLLVGRDVTRLRLEQSERQRISNLFEAVIEASPEGITVLDLRGRVKLWNAGAERIYGWQQSEVLDRPLPTVPLDKTDEFTEKLARCLRGEVSRGRITRRQRRDGTPVEVRISTAPFRDQAGEIVGTVSVVADISHQRLAERALNRYRLVAENTKEIVLFVHPTDLRILDANKAAIHAYGYSLEQLCRMTICDLRKADEPEFVAQQLQLAFECGATFETRHTRRDGRSFPAEISSAGAFVDGEPALVNIVRDITERHRREQIRSLAHEMDHGIMVQDRLDRVLSAVGSGLADLYETNLVTITILNEDGQVLNEISCGKESPAVGEIAALRDVPKAEMSPAAQAIMSGDFLAGDLRGEPVVGEWRPRLLAAGFVSYAACPLIARGDTVGAMAFFASREKVFEQGVSSDLQWFAGQIASAVMSSRAQHQIQLQKAALEATANAVVIAEPDGKIVWVNPAFTRLTGYEPGEVLGRTPRVLKSGVHSTAFYKLLWETVRSGMIWQGEMENRRKDGSIYLEEQTITPVMDAHGTVSHFIAIKQDVSERKRRESELQFLLRHDPLTGLLNRTALEERLEKVIATSDAEHPGVFALLDVDRFNSVNDSMGHPTGDQVLIQLAQLLQTAVRPGDLVARYGDDEFAIVADRISLEDGRKLVERIRHHVESANLPIEGLLIQPTVSIGLVTIDGKHDVAALMICADAALYRAKESGRNQVAVYAEETGGIDPATAPTLWANRIKEALKLGHFVLYYQPVVRLETGEIDHYEALIRMIAPDGSVVLPGEFLEVAEQLNLMPLLDRWVVDAALSELRNHDTLRLFVNLSGQSMNGSSFLESIVAKIRECGPEVASRLTFEITETVAVRHLTRAQQWMSQLDKLGCRFALDDFGMGFSSFSYLQALPVHFIKIDGSFVRNIDTSATNRALVQAIASVAHTLGKGVIAEWVESPSISRILRGFGVTHGQGYGLGRPAPTHQSPSGRLSQ